MYLTRRKRKRKERRQVLYAFQTLIGRFFEGGIIPDGMGQKDSQRDQKTEIRIRSKWRLVPWILNLKKTKLC